MKLKLVLFALLSISVLIAKGQDSNNIVNYLVVRSNSLDKDSCIYRAYEKFLNERSAIAVKLQDDYLFLEKYDSLIILEEENSEIGQAIQKVKNATSMAKSILGYSVCSAAEKHDMALIQPAAELYFEETHIADTIQNCIMNGADTVLNTNYYVVVSLLKAYSNKELLADLNRTAKIAGVFTGGLSYVTSSIVKKALSATAGQGYSVIAANLFYKFDKASNTFVNVGKTNNYGIIKLVGNSSKDEILESATLKALLNTEEELLKEYANVQSEPKQIFNNIKSMLGIRKIK